MNAKSPSRLCISWSFFLCLMLTGSADALTGDEENRIQEEALEISIDQGSDSPEMDEYLDKNKLLPEDMDFHEDAERNFRLKKTKKP